jgi:ectoine utilization protein EutC
MDLLVLREPDLRRLVSPSAALAAVRAAFVKLARGQATLPGVIGLDLPERHGEVHVKGAHLHGSPFYSIKEAAGFYGNAARGLPVSSGLVVVFDAATGFPRALLLDNGFLTELRTGAAGALAADLLARKDAATVGIIGSGGQARYQLEALLGVRRPRRVLVYGRSPDSATACTREMTERFALDVRAVATAREAVAESDVVITTTPSREPIVRADWIRPGTHVTAMGSDGPDKRELEGAVLARADKVVADRLDQCLRLGEIHHAVAEGVLDAARVHGELGELAAGLKPGRTSDEEITVADLTGVGVQDAAMADLVMAAAVEAGVGETLPA